MNNEAELGRDLGTQGRQRKGFPALLARPASRGYHLGCQHPGCPACRPRPERLKPIAQETPFQVGLPGKAHPRDMPGKELIERLHHHIGEFRDIILMAYLPNYDMDLALALVSGVDVWLNTPLVPMEASGTSGMKAAFNGVLNLSVLDGWCAEGFIDGVTGWAIGQAAGSAQTDAESSYRKLEQVVLPRYHGDRAGWIAVMKDAIGRNASDGEDIEGVSLVARAGMF